jgi:DNA-directed RNA polymerase subunit K/omega
MSALKATKDPKRNYDDSSDEEEDDLHPDEAAIDDEDEEDDEEDDDDDGEIPEETEEEYEDDVATMKTGFGVMETVEQEPTDLEMLSMMENIDDEESLLVSNDTLNIHTSPYLTKYELTKVLSLRSEQILTGAPPTVPASEFPDKRYPVDPYSIALMELKMSRLPLIIGRRLPNNTIIRIPVQALLIPE